MEKAVDMSQDRLRDADEDDECPWRESHPYYSFTLKVQLQRLTLLAIKDAVNSSDYRALNDCMSSEV